MSAKIVEKVTPISRHPRYYCEREPQLSKLQLANEIGYSRRWIEMMMRDHGLPYERLRNGYTRFRLSEVLEWMEERRSA